MIKQIFLAAVLALSTIFSASADSFDDRLQAFDLKENTTTANAFFQQLLDEQFLDEPVTFEAGTPVDELRAEVWYWAAEYLYSRAEYSPALEYGQKALPLIKDESPRADCTNLLSLICVRQADYENALKYARDCYALDEASGDPDRISSSLNTIAGICLAANRPQEGEQYVLKGLEAAYKTDNTARQAVLEGMASEIYHALGEKPKALEHIEKAYKLDSEAGRTGRAMVRQVQRSSVLLGMHRWTEAEAILNEVIPFLRQTPDRHSLAIALNKKGQSLLSQDRDPEAAECYREAAGIFMEMGDIYNEIHSRRGIYEAMWTLNPDEAKANLDRFTLLKDSLYSISSAEMLAKYNAEFGADELKGENEQAHKGLKRAILITVILAILAGIIMLGMTMRHKRQAKINEKLSSDIEDLREKYRKLGEHYDNALITSSTASDAELKAQDRAFLETVVAATNELILKGSVDATSVAESLGMSPFQLRQRISEVTGDTPQVFIQNIRMRRARHLLDNHRELNISQIAILCAYSDTPNFTRAFKNTFGITPTQYLATVSKK